MKIKLLASSLVMAGALMASGSASAGVFASGTINDWINGTLTLFDGATQAADGTVTDADGDALFQYTGLWADGTTLGLSGDLSGFENDVLVTLSEFEFGPVLGDNYSVDINYLPIDGVTGNGDYQYKITALGEEKLTSVSQDSTTISSTENVHLALSAAADGSGTFYTSDSFAGAPVPATGHNNFAARTSLYASGLLTANEGVITATSDQFDVKAVPEPMTLALMGIGLAAFGARRRFS